MRILGTAALMLATLLAAEVRGAEDPMSLDLSEPVAANLPDLPRCVEGGRLRFASPAAAPSNAPCFFIRYAFSVPQEGLYCLEVAGPGPGMAQCSRYAWSVDGGQDHPVLRRQIVSPAPDAGTPRHVQDPVQLTAGAHTLELRFRPDDRMRAMNRVDQPFSRHFVQITSLRFIPAPPRPPVHAPARPSSGLALHSGDSVVLFGDSITEEAHYGRHFVRLLTNACPDRAITVYNAGISLNRTWEALARVDLDVMALHPTWAILAFGVNDCVHMAPEEFGRNYTLLVRRLRQAGIQVLCTTPSGMTPYPDHDGAWFHTPDRAAGFDRTVAFEAHEVCRIARENNVPCADVFGAFTRVGLDRRALMANQWHPNDAGGRVFALALLRALGLSGADVARMGDPQDLSAWKALEAMPAQDYPAPGVTPQTAGPFSGPIVVASSFTRNAVYAFAGDGKLLACVPVGPHPMGLAYSAKRRELYVTCEGNGSVEVIALPSFKLQDPIKLGDVYPDGIVLSPDESSAWTANFFGSGLSQIDLAKRTVIRTVPLGALTEGVAFCPAQNTVVAATRGHLAFVNATDGAVLKTAKATDYAASFFRAADGQLFVIDTATWQTSLVDPAAETALPAAAAPYPARAVALDAATGALWAGDAARGKIVRLDGPGAKPQDVAEVECPFGVLPIPEIRTP